MVSYTDRNGLEQQDTGSNNATWGGRLNANVIALVDEKLSSVLSITVSSNVTLTNTNGVSNQARRAAHVLTGDGGYTVSIPNKENIWLVTNNCAASIIYSAGATGATIEAGETCTIYCDGTDVFKGPSSVVDLSSGFSTTSTTANALATGDLTYTVEENKSFAIGMNVRISDNAAPNTNYADGVVKSYSGTTLVVTVTSVTGSGTPASVTIAFSQAQVSFPSDAAGLLESDGAGTKTWRGKASQAEAEAGADNDKYMTSLRVKQSIDANTSKGLTLLAQSTASSSADVSFTSGIDSTYDEYWIHVLNAVPATDSVNFDLYASTDGGSSYLGASSYDSGVFGTRFDSGASIDSYTTAGAQFRITGNVTIGSAANENGICCWIKISRPSAAEYTSIFLNGNYINSSSGFTVFNGGGRVLSTSALDAFKLQFSSGNIESGEFKLYGIVKS